LCDKGNRSDAERLSQDPTFRLIGSEKIWDRGAALPSRLHWFETEVLSQEENLEGLSRINRELLAKGNSGLSSIPISNGQQLAVR
jgi:hypothetical protein